ncbi:amino acid ABC transporter substrate-binding protein [Salinarimonas soli]|uniref:Amino acid ABC transporter substrate-binding protein n=1 Tax=Salinarimonas soli TaxID=1638099 RepID=A0A5B2VI86_9HYPH|nr:amino acid ABC transporter substrate-binding protein [Salinarimonas soli]KAA2238266.1 amino acid ABC transporter substrate-binding protein [Salinarimonas soli]
MLRGLGAVVVAASLCGPAAAAEPTGTLKKIKETATIVLGVRDSSVPFSYLGPNQQPVGYTIDICLQIADAIKRELGLKSLAVTMTSITPATRIPLMANGTVDLDCGSTTNNAERQRQVAFTNTHFLATSRILAKTAANVASLDDLKGKPVVSTAGTTNIRQLHEINAARSLGLRILAARDHGEAFLMLETDRAAAFVMDDILLSSLVATAKDPSAYALSEEALSMPEPYGIMFRRNDEPFKRVVDKATADLFGSPDIQAIYDRWFTQPIPPRGIVLNVPMAPALRRAFAHPTDSPDPASYFN